jgi:hypothetical protein
MGDDAALILYLVVLWIAVLGIMAPASPRSIVCIRAKQLGAVTFVVLVLDTVHRTGGF